MNSHTNVALPQESGHAMPGSHHHFHAAAAHRPASLSMRRSRRAASLRHALVLLPALLPALAFLGAANLQAQAVFSAWQSLNTTAPAQTVTVTATGSGAVSTVEVLTGGKSGLEFAKGGGASTCESATVSPSSTCTESVTFTPSYPGLRVGAVVLLDSNSNVLGTAYLSGVGQGGLDVLTPGNVIDIAGVFKATVSTANNIPATSANLKQPAGVALDGAGNMYIADSAHNEIRMVCAGKNSATIAGVAGCSAAGIIVDLAGTGNSGYMGNNVPASGNNVEFNAPSGVALDGAGNLFIADTGNNVVREITAATGYINTVAGDGTLGFGGDGTKADAPGVELNQPWGVTVDVFGNLYIADTSNQRIRRVDAVTGIITTIAGNGTASGVGDGKGTFSGDGGAASAAGLSLPYAVAFDVYGDMFIPDSANNRIRTVKATSGVITSASIISTAVGTGVAGSLCTNGATNTAELNSPEGVALDAASNIYISDTGDLCVRKANVTRGQIVSIALSQTYNGSITLAGVPAQEEVYEPIGIVLDGLGNVYYADYYFMEIEEIQSNKAVLDYELTPIRQGNESAPQTQIIENDGNATANVTTITPDANAAVDAGTTTCAPNPFTLNQDSDCGVGAIFAPSVTIDPKTLPGIVIGNVDVANDTINSLLDIVVIGNATAVNSTTITLASNPNPSTFGQTVTFTAKVSTGSNTGALNGTVSFADDTTGTPVSLGTAVPVNGSGVASLQFSTLSVGVHTITATYNGDATHLASQTPATDAQTVTEATSVSLAAAPASPSQLGQAVTFTATVKIGGGATLALDGTVTFTDNVAALINNTVPVNNGTVTFATAALVQGVNVITATYTPATSTLIQGSSGTLNQDVVSASSTTLVSAPNPSTYGSAVTFTVAVPTAGSAAATGKVNVVIVPQGQASPTYPLSIALSGSPAGGTATISALPVGTYTATATYAGDSNYASSTAMLAAPQVVSQVQTATALAASPNPGIAGQSVAITATVTPVSGTVTPTGSVTFTDTFNGTTLALGTGAVTLSGSGKATFSTSKLAPGTHTITATYGGDADDASSTATVSLTINQATTTTVVKATPNPVTVQGTITFSATVTTKPAGGTPTGTVSFFANGTIQLGTANLSAGGTASVTSATLGAGTYQITSVYSGDTDNAGSTSASVSEVVGLIPTASNITTASTTGANSQTILVATVEDSGMSGPVPTGTVTFSSGTTVIGTAKLDASGVATLTPQLGSGTFNISVSYPGDTLHGPSKSTAVTVTGYGSSYNLAVNPTAVSVATTQNSIVTVSVTSISGFADTIGLGCASLPAGVNCHFSNVALPLAANGTATEQLTIDTNNPLGGGATAMNTQSSERKVAMAGLFLPLSLLMGWILWKFRKRHSSVWSVVLILVLSGAAFMATGCIGFTQNSAAPGTYTFQVVGVGVNSNVTQYQTVTLTITGGK
jgi:hypothetical protein